MANATLPIWTLMAQSTARASNIALATFIIYTLAVFVLAGLAHCVLQKRKFLSEYFLGSRGLGVFGFTLTYGATSASAGSFAGFPAFIYTHGWVLALWIASYMVVPICGMGLFGKRFNQVARKTGAITVPEMLSRRFESPSVGMFATLMIVFMLSFYLIPQFKIASYILQTLLSDVPVVHQATAAISHFTEDVRLLQGVDAEYLLCLLVFAVLTVFYTTFGGFRAVVWTDILQGFVMVTGVLVMMALALYQVGGLRSATEKLAKMTPPEYGTVLFETPVPTASDVRIESDTWFTEVGRDGGPRLFRTNELAVITAQQRPINTRSVPGMENGNAILNGLSNVMASLLRYKTAITNNLKKSN